MRRSIRVIQKNNRRIVDLRGNWTIEEIREIANRYSNSEIYVNKNRVTSSDLEKMNKEELSPERLALKRFEEKRRDDR